MGWDMEQVAGAGVLGSRRLDAPIWLFISSLSSFSWSQSLRRPWEDCRWQVAGEK